jgi:hypothetical protein
MKKLSHKDLIIALGIAVAAIIIVSSIYFKDTSAHQGSSTQPAPEKTIKPTVLLKNALDKMTSRSHL